MSLQGRTVSNPVSTFALIWLTLLLFLRLFLRSRTNSSLHGIVLPNSTRTEKQASKDISANTLHRAHETKALLHMQLSFDSDQT